MDAGYDYQSNLSNRFIAMERSLSLPIIGKMNPSQLDLISISHQPACGNIPIVMTASMRSTRR